MTAVILVMAWVGAVAWPAVAAGAGIVAPRVVRHPLGLLLAGGVTVAWVLGVWAFLIEPRLLVVREVRVESPAWHGEPVRVGIISDVHVGPHMSPERVRRIAARMSALEADVVLLAGDYVSGHVGPGERSAHENATIIEGLAAFGDVEARLGTYAALGNHDWWYDGPIVETAIEGAGVPVLENAALRIERAGGDFWVVGLADYVSERAEPDWNAALAGVPAGDDVIAVGHWPDIFFDAPDRVALTAAGHSHCGQIYLPFIGRLAISEGAALWPCGLYREDGKALYVTGGVGVSFLPARFRAPPEIVIVTLARAPSSLVASTAR